MYCDILSLFVTYLIAWLSVHGLAHAAKSKNKAFKSERAGDLNLIASSPYTYNEYSSKQYRSIQYKHEESEQGFIILPHDSKDFNAHKDKAGILQLNRNTVYAS